MSTRTVADRLLDAQVRWVIDRLTGPELPGIIESDIDELLLVGTRLTVADVIDPDHLKQIARTVATAVPSSSAASTVASVAADVVHQGPGAPVTLSEVIDRDNVERIVTEVIGAAPLIERALDDLTESPQMASVATRFLNHLLSEMMAANRAAAEKIPGMGGLMSVGAGVTNRVKGVADKQIEAMVGGTAARGGQFAARRLNKIIVQTLKDPATQQAVMEVFDLYADTPIHPVGRVVGAQDVKRIAGLVQDIVIAGAPTEPVLALVDAMVDGFFASYGPHPVTTLVTDLDLTREDLIAHATDLAGQVVGAAHESGHLESLVRSRLASFFASDEVAAILAELD